MAALEKKLAALSTHPPKFAVRGRFVHANARRAGLIEFVEDGLIVVEELSHSSGLRLWDRHLLPLHRGGSSRNSCNSPQERR